MHSHCKQLQQLFHLVRQKSRASNPTTLPLLWEEDWIIIQWSSLNHFAISNAPTFSGVFIRICVQHFFFFNSISTHVKQSCFLQELFKLTPKLERLIKVTKAALMLLEAGFHISLINVLAHSETCIVYIMHWKYYSSSEKELWEGWYKKADKFSLKIIMKM